jgi:hypothetical protein
MMSASEEDERTANSRKQRKTQEFLDAYFEQIQRGDAQDEGEEFNVMVMEQFCLNVYNKQPIAPWIMMHLANTFSKILEGGAWEEEFHLPWMEQTKVRPAAKQRKLEIYCFVAGELSKDKNQKTVTELLNKAVTKFNCSFETARAGYYEWQKELSELSKK